MVVAVKGITLLTSAAATVAILSMFWRNSAGGNDRKSAFLLLVEGSTGGLLSGGVGGARGGGFWGAYAPSNVGIAVAVTAMAGVALAATIVYSRRGSLKSPWSHRRRKNALSPQQWKNLFTPEGRFRDGGVKFLKKVRSGGVDPSIRSEVWPFLLGLFNLNSTLEERDSIRVEKRKEYENLRIECVLLLMQNEENVKSTQASRTNSVEDNETINKGMNSPGSDVSGRESIGFDPESPKHEERNLQIHDKTPHTPDLLVEEDESESGITHVDQSPVTTESSDSDSVEESQIMQTSPPVGESGEADPSRLFRKESSPSKEETNSKVQTTEDYITWQRIIRLDAVRANAEWVVYSPAQAVVTKSKAFHLAEAVGLKDYDHLEPCRVFHASRLVAILEAYALYDPEIGYCQGMSDLLSPLIAMIEEDYVAFWCFVGFMRKARHNFRLDEVGIRRQLSIVSKIIKHKDSHLFRHLQMLQAEDCFFVYRMVVVLFRRELTFEQTLCLWEVMWADQAAIRAGIGKSVWGRIRLRAPPTDDLLLYAIAASVLQRRKLIIEKYSGMDEIIRECNSMAGHLDVWKLLNDAHDLVVTLHDKI